MASIDAQPTQPVRVRVYLRSGAVITGLAHIQVGGYQKRLSDVLNMAATNYIPVTEATYTVAGGPDRTTDCILVNVSDISMVDATAASAEDAAKTEPNLPGSSF